jgi:uncharacterized membrane protein
MMKETHARTLTKTVVYRVLSVIAIILLSLAFGASDAVAGVLGLGAVVLGTVAYYIHDRVWLRFAWLTSDNSESRWRSLIKSVTYRLIAIGLAFAMAKIFLTTSNSTAAAFTIAQMAINFVLYFVVERVFNLLAWGKRDDAVSEITQVS